MRAGAGDQSGVHSSTDAEKTGVWEIVADRALKKHQGLDEDRVEAGVVGPQGFEPWTERLKAACSTTELRAHS